ncbi:hypothetical protein ACFL2T_03575 [Elusimicrobiota bacterium]
MSKKTPRRLRPKHAKTRSHGPGVVKETARVRGRKLLSCNRCTRSLENEEVYYLVKTRITSEPTEVSFTEEELAQDHEAEMRKLTEELKELDSEELQDQVYVILEYYLCVKCKDSFVRVIRKGPRRGRT